MHAQPIHIRVYNVTLRVNACNLNHQQTVLPATNILSCPQPLTSFLSHVFLAVQCTMLLECLYSADCGTVSSKNSVMNTCYYELSAKSLSINYWPATCFCRLMTFSTLNKQFVLVAMNTLQLGGLGCHNPLHYRSWLLWINYMVVLQQQEQKEVLSKQQSTNQFHKPNMNNLVGFPCMHKWHCRLGWHGYTTILLYIYSLFHMLNIYIYIIIIIILYYITILFLVL